MELSSVPVQKERLVTRSVGDDTLIVPLAARPEEMSHIFILNPVGAFVWRHLDGSRRIHELVDLALEEFDAEREVLIQDVREFLAELQGLGLVTLTAPLTAAAQEG